MSTDIIDAIASGSLPSDIASEIKDILFVKASDRIDTYREVAAANLFVGAEEDAVVGEEE